MAARSSSLTDLLHEVRDRYRLVHVDETQSVLLLYVERLLRATGCDVLRLRHLQSMAELVIAARPPDVTGPGGPTRVLAMEHQGRGSADRLRDIGAELRAEDLWQLGWTERPPSEPGAAGEASGPGAAGGASPARTARIRRCNLRELVYHEGRELLVQSLRALVKGWEADPLSASYVELSLRGPETGERPAPGSSAGPPGAETVLRRWVAARATPRGRIPTAVTPGRGTPLPRRTPPLPPPSPPSYGGAPTSAAPAGDRPLFLLVGAPGAGKSTLLRHFAVALAREHLAELAAHPGDGDAESAGGPGPVPATRAPILCTLPADALLQREGPDLDRLFDRALPGGPALPGKLVRLFVELGLCVLLLDGPVGLDTVARMQRQPTLVGGAPPKVLLCTRARYFAQGREASPPALLRPGSGAMPVPGAQGGAPVSIEEAVHGGWDLGYLDPLDDARLGQYLLLRLPDPVLRSAALGQLARSDNLRRLCRRPGLVAALTDASQGPALLGAGFAQGAPSPSLLELHRRLRPTWLEGVAGDRRIERTAREAVARVLSRRLLRHGAPVSWWDLVPEVGAEIPGEPDGARLLLHLVRALDDTMFIVQYEDPERAPRLRFALPSAADYFTGEDIAARLTTVDVSRVQVCPQRGHRGPVRAVALSPGGRLSATGGDDATIRVWETQSGFLLRALAGHRDPVTALCFLQDEHLLASAGPDLTVRLWDVRSGAQVQVLVGHTAPVTCLCYATFGATFGAAAAGLLVSGALDGTVRLWALSRRPLGRTEARPVRTLSLPAPANAVTGVSLSADGRTLGVTSPEGLHVYRLDPFARLFSAAPVEAPGPGGVRAVALSPDGQLCAGGGEGAVLRVLRVPGGKPVLELPAPDHHVTALSFSPDGALLAAAGAEGHLYLYDVTEPDGVATRVLLRRKEHLGEVHALAFAVGDASLTEWRAPLLLTGGGDSVALLWDLEQGQVARTLDGSAAPFLDSARRSEPSCIEERAVQVRCLAVSPDGEWLAAGSADGRVRLWSLRRGRLCRELGGHEGAVLAVGFSPDGRLLGSGAEDQTVTLWDVQAGEAQDRLEGHFSDVTALAFSPGGVLLATGSDDETVRVREVAGGMLTSTLSQPAPVTKIVFSPDGRYLHTAGTDGRVRTWESAGHALRTLAGHLGAVRALALSADGRLLASAGDDQVVRVWDAGAGRAMHALRGHFDAVTALAFSPDGAVLASCGLDRSVRLWEARSGRALRVLETAAPLRAVSFTPDGRRLLAGGDDGIVGWQVPEGRVVAQLLSLGAGWMSLCPVAQGVPPGQARDVPPGPRLALYAAEPEVPAGLRMSDGLSTYPLSGWTRLCLRPGLLAQTLQGRPYPVLEDLQVELQAAPVPMPVLESSGSKANLGASGPAVYVSEPLVRGRLVTADELLTSETLRGELVRGEVVPVSPTTYAPGRVSGRLQAHLAVHVMRGNLGDLPSADTGYLLQRQPDVVRAPDVSFVSRERIAQGASAGYFTGAPDLAAEVISPANGWEVVLQKAQEYLATGARLVWVVDPATRTVHVHESPVQVRILGERDVLTGGAVLPGFSVAVRELF